MLLFTAASTLLLEPTTPQYIDLPTPDGKGWVDRFETGKFLKYLWNGNTKMDGKGLIFAQQKHKFGRRFLRVGTYESDTYTLCFTIWECM